MTMTTQTTGGAPAFATFRRDALPDVLGGVSIARAPEDLIAIFSLAPETCDHLAADLAALAFQLLPVGTLSPAQKSAYGKLDTPYLAGLCAALEDVARFTKSAGLPPAAEPGATTALLDKQAAYTRLAHLGQAEANRAIDQRALVSQYLVFLLDKVTARLEDRLAVADPAEQDALLDRYAPALLLLDEARRAPAERKAELHAARRELAGRLTEAKGAEANAETELALSQDLLVSREALFALARRHAEQKGGAGTDAGRLPAAPAAATPALPETLPRRIL